MKCFNLGAGVNRLIYGIFLLMIFIGIIANLTFFLNIYEYNKVSKFVFIGTIVLGIMFRLIYGWLERCSDKILKWILIVVFLAYVLFEIYLLLAFTPSVIHDPLRVRNDAFALANHQLPEWSVYYKMFPQNVLPTTLYAVVFRVLSKFSFNPMLIEKIVSFFINTTLFITLVFAASTVSKKRSFPVLIGLGLFFLPYLWTYNLFILYTDAPLMIVWTLLVCFWWRVSSGKRMGNLVFFWWFLLSIPIFFLAQWTKASFLVSGAFAVAYLFVYFLNNQKISWRLLLVTVSLFISLIIAFCSTNKIEERVHFFQDEQSVFPIEHWMSMGWNQHSKGRFEADDVDELLPYLTKEEKKKAAVERFNKRIFEEEPRRVVWQLVNKVGILLYGGDIYQRYYRGFQKAPRWFQRHSIGVSAFLGYLSQAMLLLIYLLVISKIWRAFWQGNSQFLVPVLVILSIVSFYALLWEVNSRYAEVILGPLLLIVASPLEGVGVRLRWKTKIASVLLFACIFFCTYKILGAQAALNNIKNSKNVEKKKISSTTSKWIPVIGNSSNYIMMYGRENFELPPKSKVVQKVVLDVEVYNRLSVMKKEKQRGKFTLKYQGRTVFTTKDFENEEAYIVIERKKPFKKGEYELIWENMKKYPIKIVAQASPIYPLADHALTGVKMDTKQYLIYDFCVKI
ncbi:MAG: hypothetical protein LBT69_03430 [Lactobacillales bacterium]|jgi:hypothetical protein|nr:hypothetical protein [Lactobacillales bacterium]